MIEPTGDGELSPDVKLCECGCGRPTSPAKCTKKSLGLIKGQPTRYLRGHSGNKKPPPPGVNRPGPRPTLFVEVRQRFNRGVVLDADVQFLRPGGIYPVRGARLLCDCGNEYVTSIYELLDGRVQSCGCLREEHRAPWRPPGAAARREVLTKYKRHARERGYSWELTEADFDRLTSSDCYYCGISPNTVKRLKGSLGEFVYNGIDRMDNRLGYTLENSVPACAQCNRAKMDMPFDVFLAWVARLTQFQFLNPEVMPSAMLKAAAISQPALRVVNPGDVA